MAKSPISKTEFDKLVHDPQQQSAVWLAEQTKNFNLGYAWEMICKLHDDFDDDVWWSLEMYLFDAGVLEERIETNLYRHYPSYDYDSPPDDVFQDAQFEAKYFEYKCLILNQLYEVTK